MNNDSRPIGLFDSGIGGTSIWHAVHKLMPYENTIFLGDSAHAPYGQKSKEELLKLSSKNVEWLLKKQAKIIIIACNTATTNVVSELRQIYKVPIIGIEPAIKPAALRSKTGKIGVLATQRTLDSSKYIEAQKQFPQTCFINQAGHKIVPLIEAGKLHSEELFQLLIGYLTPMLEQSIDYLVLGCTHYPYLRPVLEKIVPKNVKIIDSGEAIALQTKRILEENNLLKTDQKTGEFLFYTNKETAVLQSFIEGFGIAEKVDF